MTPEDVEMEMKLYLARLREILEPWYLPPDCPGGHDITHVRRMITMGERILEVVPDFNLDEFEVAVWLHNLDRSPRIDAASAPKMAEFLLADSPFDEAARARIVDAVMQHPKRDDEPGDSQLLTALRIADKLDRLGPLGIMASVAFHGGSLLPYNERVPFGYSSTVEEKLRTQYAGFFRVLEWVGMLPSDAARALIVREDLAAYIAFVRALGAQLARVTGRKNEVEADIEKALGKHYAEYA